LNQDLRVKLYINNILKQLGCPEGHISMIYMAKKIKILFCYLDARSSTSLKSSHLYLKVVNKNNKKKENKRKRHFLKVGWRQDTCLVLLENKEIIKNCFQCREASIFKVSRHHSLHRKQKPVRPLLAQHSRATKQSFR
jgi:hypothetical protein